MRFFWKVVVDQKISEDIDVFTNKLVWENEQ